ncbi:MerR family transcriptional regulator [Kocuria sp.]|uniref:MerR family transcriptional regulator n=1 Tax=Kocuria sp. TaxID=1871328 RepID=UPI0026E00DAD|nr:MerR family transcriptional regulator [Kocuria sp.]MDO5618601.1 MerR family transcriptional regulator [Kocuria sp.]
MKISALSAQTGVSVATLKFYLRKGLLQPGRPLSRTQADYDHTHVERLRLIRALTEIAGLSLEDVGRVLATLEDPDIERLGLLGTAQRALSGPSQDYRCVPPPNTGQDMAVLDDSLDSDSAQQSGALGDHAGGQPSRARAWIEAHGWRIGVDDPLVEQLDQAWAACDDADLGVTESRMNVYAEAAEKIARVDVNSVPSDPAGAVHQVILGTLLMDPVLKVLRRLAQQHLSATTRAGVDPQDEDPTGTSWRH